MNSVGRYGLSRIQEHVGAARCAEVFMSPEWVAYANAEDVIDSILYDESGAAVEKAWLAAKEGE